MLITNTPSGAFENVTLDIVGPLLKTEYGNIYILTLQNLFSKYCILAPLPDATATSIADAMIRKLICVFGTP